MRYHPLSIPLDFIIEELIFVNVRAIFFPLNNVYLSEYIYYLYVFVEVCVAFGFFLLLFGYKNVLLSI